MPKDYGPTGDPRVGQPAPFEATHIAFDDGSEYEVIGGIITKQLRAPDGAETEEATA